MCHPSYHGRVAVWLPAVGWYDRNGMHVSRIATARSTMYIAALSCCMCMSNRTASDSVMCMSCRLANMIRLAHRGIAAARSTMHVAAGPDVQRLSPNSVVLDRLGLLEPQAMAYVDRMAARVSTSLRRNVRSSTAGGEPHDMHSCRGVMFGGGNWQLFAVPRHTSTAAELAMPR